ncbi:MAG: S8 family serine peptidase [Clostridia bacterium]|nr:S8 family serine peptidase [Clostridia bacterium]
MKKSIKAFAAALLAAVMVLLAGAPAPALVKAAAPEEPVMPPDEAVNLIVKLEGAPALAYYPAGDGRAASFSAGLRAKQEAVFRAVAEGPAKGRPAELLYCYTQVFNGFAMRGEYGMIKGIKALPGVADCYVSPKFALPEKVEAEGEAERLASSVGFINADDMWAMGYSGQGMTIAVVDTGILTSHPAFAADPEQPHFDAASLDAVLAQNELCAEQSYSGTLTGADLFNSSKIPFTFNYYAGNTDVSHAYASNDHGTHVSSIAAGSSPEAKGVAYNAQIIAMQVFNGGSADWIDIVAALEDCAYLKVDCVNMSFGADCGFTEDEDLEAVFTLLCANGVNVAAASGNAGTAGNGNIFNGTTPTFNYDNGTTSTPACLRGAMSVAASLDEADHIPASYSSWGSTSDLRIKPEIMAPGDGINAAVDPEYSGGWYDIKSGTSMATPHIAGGMALVKQYVRANFPDFTDEQVMEMVNTLIMCTASPAELNGALCSPRQQGAGQADLTAAVSTKAYIDVPGELRPKLELGDDDDKTGVFAFSFDVVNFGDRALTYTVDTRVLTEQINMWLIGYSLVNIMNHASEDITSYCSVNAPASVTVPAGGRTTVSVSVDLAGYKATIDSTCPLGMYIDGFVRLRGETDLSVPFLGFYGDWEYGAMFDRKNYYDQYTGASQAYPNEWGTNRAVAYMGDSTVLLGMNPFASTTNFLLDRSSLSPNADGRMDEIGFVHTYLLRNAETFRYEVVDAETGEQYFVQELHLLPKAVGNSIASFYQPVGAEELSAIEHWGGAELADGTHCVLRMTGYMQSVDPFDPSENENAVWEVPITVDKSAPELISRSFAENTLSLSVRDNHYTAFIGVYSNAACTAVISERAVEEPSRGAVTSLSVNVGSRNKVWVKLGDYAGNTAVFEVEREPFLMGDCDLNGIVDSGDALLALRYSLNLASISELGLLAGDVDGNGEVNPLDALMILRYVLGLIPEL